MWRMSTGWCRSASSPSWRSRSRNWRKFSCILALFFLQGLKVRSNAPLVLFEAHTLASRNFGECLIHVRLGPRQIVILLDGTLRKTFIDELTSGIFDRRILATRDKGL